MAVELPDGEVIELEPDLSRRLARRWSNKAMNRNELTRSERIFVWHVLGRSAPVPKKMTVLLSIQDVLNHFPPRDMQQ